MNHQRGSIFISILGVIAVVGIAIVMAANNLQAQALVSRSNAEKLEYLDNASEKVETWYRSHLSTVDALVDAPSIDTVVAEAGITLRLGLKLVASQRLTRDNVAYRVFVLWLPQADPDASTWNPATGDFSPAQGAEFRLVSGYALQSEAIAETERAIKSMAISLVNFFAARYEAGGKDVSINHFRPDGTCSGATGLFPCLDTYTPANAIDWSAIGLSPLDMRDAWGNPLQLSNLLDSNTTGPPYSIAIRSQTPFGRDLVINAFQRL